MAKSESPFDDDFEAMNRRASQTLQLLSKESKSMTEQNTAGILPNNVSRGDGSGARQRSKSKSPTKPFESPRKSRMSPVEWGPPMALFNTRIPQGMSDRLDDLAYKLKKAKVKPATKQALAQEALEDLLRKHGMLRPCR